MLTVHPLATRRAKAYARDCLGYFGIAAATVPLGIVAQRAGLGTNRRFVLAVSAVPPVLAALLAARQEAGPPAATPGKRRYQLMVETRTGETLTFRQALLRNLIKITLPWQLGHTVAIGAAFGGFDNRDPCTIGTAVITYPLVAVMIVGVVTRSGRAPHDRLTGSHVIEG
jgi:uncharacterized RDD family membrane protein YckC